MKKSALAAALVALGVTLAQADISIPVGASDFATAASDAAGVKTLYGTSAFPNADEGSYGADAVNLTAEANALKLSVDFAAIEEPDNDYSANTGIIQPITPNWDVKDLTGLTSISFDVRITSGKLKQFKVGLNSDAYSKSELNAGTTLIAQSLSDGIVAPTKKMTFSLSSTSWQTITLTKENFGYSKWNGSNPAVNWEQAIKKLKAIQFSPETDYTSSGIGATGGTVTMEVKNIVLKGVDAIPLVKGVGCTGTPFTLADASVDASKKNMQGGYWYGFTDTSSVQKDNDSAVGDSRWAPEEEGLQFDETGFHFSANLNKTVAGTYHKYAGWAAIGTGFKLDGEDAYVPLPNFKAAEFTITGATLSPLVDGINFKVELNGVTVDATHQVMIPSRQLTGTAKICVDAESLAQPGWHEGNIDFDPSIGVGKFSWEVKIADQGNSSITSAPGQKFTVDKVKLYGVTEEEALTVNSLKRSAFAASYLNGQIKVAGLDGFKTVDVVTLSGAKVASFAPNTVANVKLNRGTYLLVARGANKTLVRSLPVLF